jgi:L-aminopeptidase/D-esterase-like protein
MPSAVSTGRDVVMRSTVRAGSRLGQGHWTAASTTATLCLTMERAQPGSDGSICDVPGIAVGHATDPRGVTGCTVVLCEAGAVGGVDVRGAAPGTRETDLLRPECTVEYVNAILLTGGSAFGLDAAAGVMRFLEERGHGFPVQTGVVPIVPAAVIFDLGIGDARARPEAAMGIAACEAASTEAPEEGSVGAGTGATIGKSRGLDLAMKGGVGTASVRVDDVTVGALVVVNAVGDVVDESGRVIAGARLPESPVESDWGAKPFAGARSRPGESTTIGVVATDLPLDKAGATRLAQAAHDGLARAIRPAHTAFDGDAFFALSTARDRGRVWPLSVSISAAAADVVALAIRRAVRLARGQGGVPGLADATDLGTDRPDVGS